MNITEDIENISLDIESLSNAYCANKIKPAEVIREVYRRISSRGQDYVWTCLVPQEEALTIADRLSHIDPASLPLYGIPFSVKDNIHVKGMVTTASCPAFARYPDDTATVVKKMLDAGAILVGKNTMDQFATGLVGIRSPGHPVNPFNSEYIPGGSSSGSAVSVATGLVSFSLGSDTGGSGRIPAALNNVVGLKPTPGVISANGMVYANRSFDCVPIFALTCSDAKRVFDQAVGPDINDPFMRHNPLHVAKKSLPANGFRVGIPDSANRTFFGDSLAEQCFTAAVDRIKRLGGTVVEVDFSLFIEAGKMLFDGPLLAERLASLEGFLETNEDDVNPVVKSIVEKARTYSAVDLCREYYRIAELKGEVKKIFSGVDVMMVPTAGTIYKIRDVESDPVNLNKNMGYYTYFANILQLSAIAVPAAIREDGLPFGVCFLAGPQEDAVLVELGAMWQKSTNLPLGI